MRSRLDPVDTGKYTLRNDRPTLTKRTFPCTGLGAMPRTHFSAPSLTDRFRVFRIGRRHPRHAQPVVNVAAPPPTRRLYTAVRRVQQRRFVAVATPHREHDDPGEM